MIAEYNVNLENKTKSELILFTKELQDVLKEKDKEIERLRYIKKSFDHVVQKETEKKNKQIDLMAEYIDGDDTSLANYLYRKNGKCNKKMIKQYFEKLAKEKGE